MKGSIKRSFQFQALVSKIRETWKNIYMLSHLWLPLLKQKLAILNWVFVWLVGFGFLLFLLSWQCQILNPLIEARDRTRILVDTSRVCFR